MGIITKGIKVEGMSCSHCENSIKSALNELNGVHEVNVYLADKKVIVEYDDEKLEEKTLKEIIEEQGFNVK